MASPHYLKVFLAAAHGFMNFEQKNCRMSIAQELLNDIGENPDLLKRVITGHETCVYGYEIKLRLNRPSGGILDGQDRKKLLKLGQM